MFYFSVLVVLPVGLPVGLPVYQPVPSYLAGGIIFLFFPSPLPFHTLCDVAARQCCHHFHSGCRNNQDSVKPDVDWPSRNPHNVCASSMDGWICRSHPSLESSCRRLHCRILTLALSSQKSRNNGTSRTTVACSMFTPTSTSASTSTSTFNPR